MWYGCQLCLVHAVELLWMAMIKWLDVSLFLRCAFAGFWSLLLCPRDGRGIMLQLGLALLIGVVLRFIARTPPDYGDLCAGLSTGEISLFHAAVALGGYQTGTLLAVIGVQDAKTSIAQVLISGLLHGLLLSFGPDEWHFYGTMTQGGWMSGVLFPVATASLPLTLLSLPLWFAGCFAGIMAGYLLARRTQAHFI